MLEMQRSSNPSALKVSLTDEQIMENYPWDYKRLTDECNKRYSDFKLNQKYHKVRKSLYSDSRFSKTRFLDPSKSNSSKKTFFNNNILGELDKHYTRKVRQ